MTLVKVASVEEVFRKVRNDFGITSTGWWSDPGLGWVGEALQAIGTHGGFEKCAKTLTVENHRALLPNCVESLLGVLYKGSKLNYGAKEWSYVPRVFSDVYGSDFIPYGITDPRNPEEPVVDIYRAYSKAYNYGQDEFYTASLGVINTSFEEGEITILYTAYKVDEKGWPMIPDEYEYKEAIAWYILSRLILSGTVQHPVIDWNEASARWSKSCAQAANFDMLPTIDEAEMFANLFVRMVPATANFDNINTY